MKALITAKYYFTVGDSSRRFYIFPLMMLLFGLCLGLTSPPQARAVNPGDTYVFPAQSPVAPDGTSQQGGPTLSGNIALWSEYDSSLRKTRLFFKDLSKGPGEPGHALISGEYNGVTPEINQAGNRVVWSEMIGAQLQVYSKDVDFSGSFSGCTGTVDSCATSISPGNSWQAIPGRRILQFLKTAARSFGKTEGGTAPRSTYMTSIPGLSMSFTACREAIRSTPRWIMSGSSGKTTAILMTLSFH